MSALILFDKIIMDKIDVVFYINLKHRTDRDAHFMSDRRISGWACGDLFL